MIPVLYTIQAQTDLGRWVLYLLALVLVGYAAWMGWQASPERKDGKAVPLADRLPHTLGYAVAAGVAARVGLYYALPAGVPLGGQGVGIPFHAYGVLLATGFLTALVLAAQLAEREWPGPEGLVKRDQVYDLAFWVLLSGVGGAKLLFVLVNWKDYARSLGDPSRLADCLSGGMVFYGGLIGAGLASYVFCRVRKIDFLRLADLAIPTVSLGQCLGRLGCFAAGCCWGDVAHQGFRWGVHFPGTELARNLFGQLSGTPSMAFTSQATDNRWVVESTGQILHQAAPGAVRISEWALKHGHTLPVHPTQLYESIGQLVLFVTLLSLRRYRRFHGQIFALWLMCYAVLRTSVELFRGDLERGTLHGLLGSLGWGGMAARVPLEAWYNVSTSQFISLCMFGLGAVLLYRYGRNVSGRTAAGSPAAPA
ncbi:MAG TPA: prolipoprotein diacylglyceryl transferase [Myxococcaceae bacterium]|nr:prolipoprotein diacylglyceryl transferase [Myxococcaceae bacterium]